MQSIKLVTDDSTYNERHNYQAYEKGDACYGVVSSRLKNGAYLHLDNDEIAFSYKAGNLREGTKVICSIITSATNERRALVEIDSVCYDMYCA